MVWVDQHGSVSLVWGRMSAAVAPAVEPAAPTQTHRINKIFLWLLAALWAWAIGVCVPFWENDPNYSYGWVVPPLILFYLWRRLSDLPMDAWDSFQKESPVSFKPNPWLLAIPALGLFPLEVYRSEYFQSGIVLWAINLTAVGFSLLSAWWLGGRRLLFTLAFPFLFYLTAVPWPALIAIPVQQGLMQTVAHIVAEVLLWLGTPVTMEGAQLHLTKGTVGIVEACSGIRSLQSGLMVSLAVGELLLLTAGRRAWLVFIAVMLALVSNLVRTFTLCWIMDKSGDEAMHKAHDLVGNIAMYSLYFLIYLAGKWLETPESVPPIPKGLPSWKERFGRLGWAAVPDFRPLLVTGLVVFGSVHVWYYALRVTVRPQTIAQFAPNIGTNSAVSSQEFEENVWKKLGANTGEQFEVEVPEAPMGTMSIYHLFWKPGAKSRMALGHRPDICMPGSGWKQVGDVEKVTIPFADVPMEFHVFRFRRNDSDVKAMQVWGVWRNGKPVEMDYSKKLTASPEVFSPLPTSRHLLGVELVSCFVPYRGDPPSLDLVKKHLPKYFEFTPF